MNFLLLVLGLFAACVAAETVTYTVSNASAFNVLIDSTTATTATRLIRGNITLVFTEGPLWNPVANELIVGDSLPDAQGNGNTLYIYNPSSGAWRADTVTPAMQRPLGNVYDAGGTLYSVGLNGLVRTTNYGSGTRTVLVSAFNGSSFNLLNDAAVRSDGSIYFSDPDYNFIRGTPSPQPSENIYRYDPSTSNLTRIWPATITALNNASKPNGVCFSPDETKFYFGTANPPGIWRCDATAASPYIANCVNIAPLCGADGLKTDTAGNIWAACGDSIRVYSSNGTLLGQFSIQGVLYHSNFNWGGSNGRTLYVTTQTSLDFVTFNTSLFRSEVFTVPVLIGGFSRIQPTTPATPSASSGPTSAGSATSAGSSTLATTVLATPTRTPTPTRDSSSLVASVALIALGLALNRQV